MAKSQRERENRVAKPLATNTSESQARPGKVCRELMQSGKHSMSD